MDGFVSAGLLNAGLATLLAIGAIAATAVWRNPYVVRLVWLGVLLKLVSPPLLFVPVEATWLEQFLKPASAEVISASEVASSIDHPPDSPPLADARRVAASLAETSNAAAAIPAGEESNAEVSAEASFAADFQWRELLLPLGVAWVVGSAGLGMLAVARIWRFQRLVAQSAAASPALQAKTARIAARLGLRKTPPVRIVAGRIAPLAWTLGRRSTLVLPAALVETLDREALDAVLAHELTHLRRRDGWARWLELAAVVAYWWCPTAWFARKRIHEAEELCCDADVLRRFPALRRGYGRAMLETLELLASDAPLAPGATGWGSRRSLRRRFERIGRGEVMPSLGSWKRLSSWTAIVLLCALAPTAVSSEQEPEVAKEATDAATAPDSSSAVAPATAENAQPCTVTLNDGSVINGMLIDDRAERLVVMRDRSGGDNAEPSRDGQPTLNEWSGSLKAWDLTLDECVEISLKNGLTCHITAGPAGDKILSLHKLDGKTQSLSAFESQAEDLVRDVASSYWELHFAWEETKVRRDAMSAALKLWRKAKVKYSPTGDSSLDEQQARAQFFLHQSQAQTAHSNRFRVENRLRYLLGLASYDGQVIRPSTPIEIKHRRIDFQEAEQQAHAKRFEILKQVEQVEKRQREQHEATLLVVDDEDPSLAARRTRAAARHATLVAMREAAVLQDMKHSVSHQLSDAVRDLELKYHAMETNKNRNKAGQDEVAAVSASYEIGRVTLDLLLQSHQRAADAASADQRSQVDYQQAEVTLHRRQGMVLEMFGIRVVE